MGNPSSIRTEAILIQLATQPSMSTSVVAKSPGRWEKSPVTGSGWGLSRGDLDAGCLLFMFVCSTSGKWIVWGPVVWIFWDEALVDLPYLM